MSKEKETKKVIKKVNTVKKDIKKASTDIQEVDATFDVKNNSSFNDTLNNLMDTKMMIENEKQKLREQYGDFDKKDEREIEFSSINSEPTKKNKKTISIEDIANAINAANAKEELERKKQQERAKKLAIKKKREKARKAKLEENKKIKEAKKQQKEEEKKNKPVKEKISIKDKTTSVIKTVKDIPNRINKNKKVNDTEVDKSTTKNKTKSNKTKINTNKGKNNNENKIKIIDTIKDKLKDVPFDKYFNKNTFLFSTFIIVFLFLFVSMLIPKNNEISSRVKSNLVDTEGLTGIDFVKASIENYLVVQFPWYEQILDGYFGTLEFSNRSLYQNANNNSLILIDSKDGIYIDGDENQLIRKYEVEEKNQDIEIGRRIKLFNEMAKVLEKKSVNSYIYAISGIWTSEAILNFELDYKEPLKYVKLFEEKISDYINFDYLKIIDYTTFKEYFFATDHHWRIHGAYQGYKDVCKLIGIPNEDLVPPKFFQVEGVEFLGSNAKVCSHDNIIDYLFDIEFDDNYAVRVDGERIDIDEFSGKSDYLKGDYEKEDVYYNHYGKYFHSDLGEIVYTFDKNKKDNRRLLLIGDSYSNCIDKLIASHFYKTYVIDLRYYESSNGEKFVLEDYIDENNITDCLVMLSANSVYFESADLDLGLKESENNK